MGADHIVIDTMMEAYSNCQPLNEGMHKYVMEMFHLYLLVGGLPEAVNQFVSTQDVYKVRQIQKEILDLYKVDASQMHAHGIPLFYYDNKKAGEVDFIIDDFSSLSVLPIEIKSGKDYYVHSALNALLKNNDYGVKKGIVFSNSRDVKVDDKGVVYMPIYYSMFISGDVPATDVTVKIPILEN